MTPRAVLFDCDGVLVDSEPVAFEMLAAELSVQGLPMRPDQIEHLFLGGTMTGLFQQARQLGATLPDDWVSDFYGRFYARLAQGTPLIDGIETVLDALDAARIPYAVGSNGTEQKMQVTLGQHPALLDRLQGRPFSGQSLGAPKPAPDLYLHAARALGVAASHCVVVEDSPTGCIAARRAGMKCYGYAARNDGARLAAEGAILFHRMQDLPALLGLPA